MGITRYLFSQKGSIVDIQLDSKYDCEIRMLFWLIQLVDKSKYVISSSKEVYFKGKKALVNFKKREKLCLFKNISFQLNISPKYINLNFELGDRF